MRRRSSWAMLGYCLCAGLLTCASAGEPSKSEPLHVRAAACESALPAAWRRGAFFLDLGYADPYAIQPVDQHGPAWGMNDPVPVNYNQAVQLSQGPGCSSHDYRQAAVYFRKAADAGYAPAQFDLALLYVAGRGVNTDPAEALRLFRLAAAGGSPRAMHALGAALLLGRRVEADQSTATAWFSKAAKAGDAGALCCRGVLRLGSASAPDSASAGLADVKAAAQTGNPVAQYDLGIAYAEGRGTAQDLQEAIRWLRDAGDRITGIKGGR